MKPIFLSILCTLLISAQASDANVLVSGNGSWDSTAPTTSYSVPSANWVFSFGLPGTLTSNPAQGAYFSYYVNGVLVGQLLDGVTFNSSGGGGLFSLSVPSIPTNSSSPALALTFTGGQAYTPGSGSSGVSLIPTPGTYGAIISMANPSASGSGTISITNVPEPTSLPLFMLGVAALGCAALLKRKSI